MDDFCSFSLLQSFGLSFLPYQPSHFFIVEKFRNLLPWNLCYVICDMRIQQFYFHRISVEPKPHNSEWNKNETPLKYIILLYILFRHSTLFIHKESETNVNYAQNDSWHVCFLHFTYPCFSLALFGSTFYTFKAVENRLHVDEYFRWRLN